MYQQKAFNCIDKATLETKKESPKIMLFCLIAGILLGLNGLSLLFFGAGIKIRFANAAFCGVLSLLAGVLLFCSAFAFLKDAVKARKEDANLLFRNDYMDMIRAIGDESAVLAHLETLPPIVCGNKELRFDQNMVACLSEDDLDSNFVYPLQSMTNAGAGSRNDGGYLFMHFLINGKKKKKSINMPPAQAQSIVQQLKAYNPNIKIGI